MNHLARNTDPETSHIAAANIKPHLGAQQRMVLSYVLRFPSLTSAELAKEYAREHGGIWEQYRNRFSRRLKELPGIEQGDKRVCGVCGNQSVTWRMTEQQQELFA